MGEGTEAMHGSSYEQAAAMPFAQDIGHLFSLRSFSRPQSAKRHHVRHHHSRRKFVQEQDERDECENLLDLYMRAMETAPPDKAANAA
ncbi:hypothetical protein RX327_18730 [Bradyrhizobium sp. BEA-2-5]|uniref:hypothetical protein n=1 Tax=Bradyrhizobium sp. BEA-2-5 TaxID=3080015 RepID=UPI00293F6DCC|nr:hypothetical protein [Bradyrhizobium sp. BEA-2-5]WOH85032.1 hypothetical protein RX327_18730 [Bradyrhizobium sp. BEA-2-5]